MILALLISSAFAIDEAQLVHYMETNNKINNDQYASITGLKDNEVMILNYMEENNKMVLKLNERIKELERSCAKHRQNSKRPVR